MADNKCLSRTSLSLEQEEKLAQKVQNFPCIFDKADKGHKEKDVVINAWNEVAKSLEFVENGMHNFLLIDTSLRYRYRKYKI